MAEQETLSRSYKFRLYPKKDQIEALEAQFSFGCALYNALLEQRKTLWERDSWRNVNIGKYDQSAEITQMRREIPFPEKMSASCMHEIGNKLDRAYQNAFSRIKKGDRAGFPKFCSYRRWNSLTWWGDSKDKSVPTGNGWRLDLKSSRLRIAGVGHIKIKLHRPFPPGTKFATLTVKREAGRWYAYFPCYIPKPNPLPISGKVVGVDMGVTKFIATSDGELIDHPRPQAQNRETIERLAQSVAKKKRGSQNRKKAVRNLARAKVREKNIRRDHSFKTARSLASKYDIVVREDLKIKNMTRSAKGTVEEPGVNVSAKSGLNREVLERGWGQFFSCLDEKAEEFGRQVVLIDPAYTSQTCSSCGEVDKESRKGEKFLCTGCGHEADADLNASTNILKRGLEALA